VRSQQGAWLSSRGRKRSKWGGAKQKRAEALNFIRLSF
jgi:hypothetical protein